MLWIFTSATTEMAIQGIPVHAVCLFQLLLALQVGGLCEFPADLRGQWVSSVIGELNFTNSSFEGFHPCVLEALCVSNVLTKWNCIEEQDHGYYISTDDWQEVDVCCHAVACIYLYNISPSLYIYYMGPKEPSYFPYRENVVVTNQTETPPYNAICNLSMHPQRPNNRYRVLIKKDGNITNQCPRSISGGDFLVHEEACEIKMVSCDRVSFFEDDSNCIISVFHSTSGKLKCVYSLEQDGASYTMLIFRDNNVHTPLRFICLVSVKLGFLSYGNIKPMKCDHVPVPRSGRKDFTIMRLNYRCDDGLQKMITKFIEINNRRRISNGGQWRCLSQWLMLVVVLRQLCFQ